MFIKNVFEIGKAVLLAHILDKKTPVNVMWRLTNKCNLKCHYCKIWKKKRKELTTEQILSLIDQMAQCRTQRIGFVGGEALLRNDFEEIVDYVKKQGIYVTLVSNGLLISDNIDIIKKLDCLILSFDGRKQNHERGRMKGSYEKLMSAFDACKRNNIKVVTLTVLNKYNLQDIDYVLDTVREFGFRSTFHVLQGNNDCYPTDDEYRNALNYLIRQKKRGAPIVVSTKTLKFLMRWPNFKRFVTKKRIGCLTCRAGQLIFNIDTDGKIAACDIMTHVLNDNPNCVELGFKKALQLVRKNDCKACTCAQMIDYHYMFSLSPSVIFGWMKLIFKRR